MHRITKSLMLSTAVLFTSAASAQPFHRAGERGNDRQELRQDGRAAADDRRDLAIAESLTARFDAARSRRDWRALGLIDRQVADQLAKEQREGEVELAKAQREVHQSKRELNRDAAYRPGAGGARADDRRDLRDDKRDARAEADSNARIAQLSREWGSLMGRQDPMSLNRKRAILAQIESAAAHEVRRDGQEIREDKREQREDRYRR